MNFVYKAPTNAHQLYQIADLAYHNSPWSENVFEHDLLNKHSNYLVLFVDDKAVGFVGGTLIIDELSISNVAIIPSFQKNNLAFELMNEWFKKFKKTTRVLLEVRDSNFSAKKLYFKLGFKQIAVRKDYYQNPLEDALIMEKKL